MNYIDFKNKLINDKIIIYKKLNLSKNEYKKLVFETCPIEIKSNNDFYYVENNKHKYLYQLDKNNLSDHEIKKFKNWCMHVDVTPVVQKENNNLDNNFHTAYVSMYMKTFVCDKKFGKTLFLNLIKLYSDCPQEYINLLSQSKLEHHIATAAEHEIDAPKKTTINLDQYKLDPIAAAAEQDIEIAKINNFPSIFYPFRTHPITKETILFWPSYSSVQLHGGSKPWFEEFKQWIKSYLDQETNWHQIEWEQGDVIIFDNRCMLHTFTPGWEPDQRVFDQIILGFEKPFYQHI